MFGLAVPVHVAGKAGLADGHRKRIGPDIEGAGRQGQLIMLPATDLHLIPVDVRAACRSASRRSCWGAGVTFFPFT